MADTEGKKPDATRRTDSSFIGKAVPDPANPQPLMRLTGYRGASSEAGQTRLYLDSSISSYVDIPDADIVYELPVPPEADPLGAVNLWVKRSSKLNVQASKQQGGDATMFGQFGTGMGQGAAPQSFAGTGFPQTFTQQPTVTQTFTQQPTFTQTFTPPPSPFQTFCPPSPPFFCPPPPSPHPIFCTQQSPLLVHCTVSPLPQLCPPSPHQHSARLVCTNTSARQAR